MKFARKLLAVFLPFALLAVLPSCNKDKSIQFSVEEYVAKARASDAYAELVQLSADVAFAAEDYLDGLNEEARKRALYTTNSWTEPHEYTKADAILVKNTLGIGEKELEGLIQKMDALFNQILSGIPESEKEQKTEVMERLGKHLFEDMDAIRIELRGPECCYGGADCDDQWACMTSVCSNYNACRNGASGTAWNILDGFALGGASIGFFGLGGPHGSLIVGGAGLAAGSIVGLVYWGYSSSECRRIKNTDCRMCENIYRCR